MLTDITNLDKIIYLDCDIIVQMDIKQLWDIPLEDCYIAAVAERGTAVSRYFSLSEKVRFWALEMPVERYFNSGVIVLNLKKIRECFDMFNESIKFFTRAKNWTLLPDQDLLNTLLHSKCRYLDRRFDTFVNNIDRNASIENTIWHFTHKPWNIHLHNKIEDLYWEYLSISAWGDNDNIIKFVLEADGGDNLHIHSSACIRKLAKRMVSNITKSTLINISIILFSELEYRIFHKRRDS